MPAPDDRHERVVPLEGTFNFRDLGGYPTADGRTTRWGRLYRSDGLQSLTAADVAELRARGLRTVVDLRTPAELAKWGRGPLEHEPVRYEHLTVIREDAGEALAAPDTDDLAARYLWYLDVGRDTFVTALELAAGSAPLVFHCVAGKDRTGVLAALILDAVGVPAEVIVGDYFLTAERLARIIDRLASRAEPGQLESVPASRLGVEAATMTRFLDLLHDRDGGAGGWATRAGVDPATLDRLRSTLLDP